MKLYKITLLLFIISLPLGLFAQSQRVFSIQDYGAKGDGTTLNTHAIQAAIDAANKAGGGRVLITRGTFVSGTLVLKSGVEIHITAGDTLLGSPYLRDYPDMEQRTIRSYTERYSRKAFIYAESATDIALTGRGMIHGNSYAPEFKTAKHGRDKPLGMRLISCKRVNVEGLTLTSAGLWLQHYLNCEDLHIEGITAINHGNFTNDGLNVDGCRNVSIKNIRIDSHDDALVFKSTGPARCENITVRNCDLKSHCHGLKFGTETTAGFRNIDIANITISASDSLHYKSGTLWRVITGIAIELVDGGTMENIRIHNLRADSVYAPVFLKLGNRARKHTEDAPEPAPGQMRNIHLSNFRITDAGPFSSSVTGFPGHPIQNVTLENIDIEYNEAPGAEELFTEVPENEKRYPEITMFTKGLESRKYLPTHGLFARHVDGLVIRNFKVQPTQDDPRPKFEFIEVSRLEIDEN
ncbi:MAG: glycosyl hydrolase family 28 protein [bacterium]|nr:glycosyl hydrolase family 28 protein [bacterium]